MSVWARGRMPVIALACGFAACTGPFLLSLYLSLGTSTDANAGILGVYCFAVALMVVALVVGWMPLMAIGSVLYGIAALETTASLGDVARPALMALIGIVLFVACGLGELSLTFRRSPQIASAVWLGAAQIMGSVVVTAAVLSVGAYAVATITTWPAVVLPVAVLALGVAIKVAADRLIS